MSPIPAVITVSSSSLDYVSDYQLKSDCKNAICIALSTVTQMIFAVLEDWYHYIVLTPSCKLVSFFSPNENDSFRKDLCFTADVFFSTREISEMRGPTGVKFCTMVSNRPYFIVPVQNFWGHTPKKFQGPKTCRISPDFGRLRSSAANISETDEDIQNRIVIPSIAISPALGETSPVKFGPVTLKISMLNRTHPKRIIRKTIFRLLGGAAPPNFYTR